MFGEKKLKAEFLYIFKSFVKFPNKLVSENIENLKMSLDQSNLIESKEQKDLEQSLEEEKSPVVPGEVFPEASPQNQEVNSPESLKNNQDVLLSLSVDSQKIKFPFAEKVNIEEIKEENQERKIEEEKVSKHEDDKNLKSSDSQRKPDDERIKKASKNNSLELIQNGLQNQVFEEIVNSMVQFEDIELLTSTLKRLAIHEKVPVNTLNLIQVIDNIKNHINSTKLEENDKNSLMELTQNFKALLDNIEKEEKNKGFGGAFPRYYWLSIFFFETKLKTLSVKIEDITTKHSDIQKRKEAITEDLKKQNDKKGFLENLEKEKLEKSAKVNAPNELEHFEASNQKLVEELKKFREINESNKEQKEKLSSLFEQTEINIENINNKIENYKNDIKELELKDYEHYKRITELEGKVYSFDQEKDQMETLEKEIRDFSGKIKEKEALILKINGILVQVKETENKVTQEINLLRNHQNNESYERKTKIEQINKENDNIKFSIRTLEEKSEILRIKEEEYQTLNVSSYLDSEIKDLMNKKLEIEQRKNKQEEWEKELVKIEYFSGKIKKEKNSILNMLEESKLGEEENITLKNQCQELGEFFEKTKFEFDIQRKEANVNIQHLKEEVLELDWRNSKGKQKHFWKNLIGSFVLTVLISFVCIGFFKLPEGTLKNLIDL